MKIVVTAGPTREPIDPVRFISNRSSGKMGFAIAEAFANDGHDVTLIAGPVALSTPKSVARRDVETADEVFEAVMQSIDGCDVLVMCAAVADYKTKTIAATKLKKSGDAMSLELVPTRDILKSLPKSSSSFVVGFAAETNDLDQNALAKLREKKCDMIVANDVSSRATGMESDENEVVIWGRGGLREEISRASKQNIARELVKIISREREKSLTIIS